MKMRILQLGVENRTLLGRKDCPVKCVIDHVGRI